MSLGPFVWILQMFFVEKLAFFGQKLPYLKLLNSLFLCIFNHKILFFEYLHCFEVQLLRSKPQKAGELWFLSEFVPKYPFFCPKMSQRAPRTPLGPPGWQKIFFRVARIWKPQARRKNFLVFPIGKKFCLTTPGA